MQNLGLSTSRQEGRCGPGSRRASTGEPAARNLSGRLARRVASRDDPSCTDDPDAATRRPIFRIRAEPPSCSMPNRTAIRRGADRLVIRALTILLAGCAAPHSSGVSRNDVDLQQRHHTLGSGASLSARAAAYAQAVDIARGSRPDAIDRNLLALTPEQDGIWRTIDGTPHVLVVTWTNFEGYPGPGQRYRNGDYEVWVTAVPELRRFVADYQVDGRRPDGTALSNRLEELLGLPPGADHKWMVEMWAPADRLFRPSADPEVTDHEASLHFPHVAAPGAAQPGSVAYLSVSEPFQEWYARMRKKRYEPESGPAYPWTRLGYTFDWYDLDDPVGLSEFVVMSGSTVVIESKTPTAHYGQNLR